MLRQGSTGATDTESGEGFRHTVSRPECGPIRIIDHDRRTGYHSTDSKGSDE
jgi:hypothetical protein